MDKPLRDAQLPAKSNFLGWMFLPYRRYAQFDGRSGRREFWWYSLWLVLSYLIAFGLLLGLVVAEIDEDASVVAILVLFGIVFLANFIPGLALTSRRFHDIGLPGWLTAFAVLAVFFLSIIGWIGYMIIMSLPPKEGENQYGPPVYGEDIADVFS